jgi:hypothetical protein
MNTFIKLFFKHFGLKSFMYIISVIGLLANQLPEYFSMINSVPIFMIMYQIIIIYFLYCVYRKDIEEFKLGISNNFVKELKILFSKVAYNYINVQEYVKNLKMSTDVNYVQHLVIIFKTETMKNLIKFFFKYFSVFLVKPLGFNQHPAAHGFGGLIVGFITCNRVTKRNLPNNILNGNIILPLGIVGIFSKLCSFINAGSIDILDVDIKWIIIFIGGGLLINILLDNLNNKDSTPKAGTKTQSLVPAMWSGAGSEESSTEDADADGKKKTKWEQFKDYCRNHKKEIAVIVLVVVAAIIYGRYPKSPQPPKGPTGDNPTPPPQNEDPKPQDEDPQPQGGNHPPPPQQEDKKDEKTGEHTEDPKPEEHDGAPTDRQTEKTKESSNPSTSGEQKQKYTPTHETPETTNQEEIKKRFKKNPFLFNSSINIEAYNKTKIVAIAVGLCRRELVQDTNGIVSVEETLNSFGAPGSYARKEIPTVLTQILSRVDWVKAKTPQGTLLYWELENITASTRECIRILKQSECTRGEFVKVFDVISEYYPRINTIYKNSPK